MKKFLTLAIILLTLFAANKATAQNYSSELGVGDLIRNAWNNAMASDADIYTEVYDRDYNAPDYSQYGNFTHEVHYCYNDNTPGTVSYSVKVSSTETKYYDKYGNLLYTIEEIMDYDKDGGWLDDIESKGRLKIYCPWCGEYIYLDEWNEHKCPALHKHNTEQPDIGNVDDDDLPPSGGGKGGGGGNDLAQSEAQQAMQSILNMLSNKPGKLYDLLKKLCDEGRVVIREDMKKAQYDPFTHKMILGPNFSLDQVVHELVHCLQDIKGQLSFNNNSVNNEFQAHLLEYIYMYTLPTGGGMSECFTIDKDWWPDFFQSILYNVDVDILDPNKISIRKDLIEILDNDTDYDRRTSIFSNFWKEKYVNSPEDEKPKAYWNSYDHNYKYKWVDYFNEYGFKIIK